MKKIIPVVLIMCFSFFLVSCVKEEQKKPTNLELNAKSEVLTLGDSVVLSAKTNNETKITWSSEDENICSVSKEGLVTALKVGKTDIVAKSEDGKEAYCEIMVFDCLVNSDYDDKINGYGINKFNKITDAVNKGGYVCVYNGEYDETVQSDKDVNLFGIGTVKLRGVSGKNVKLENLSFENLLPPESNSATVTAVESLKITKCKFTVADDSLEGGYCVFVENGCKSFEIAKSEITNYRYGIYVYHMSGDIRIIENKLTNCEFGIGVNIRGNDNMFDNFKVSGVIKQNIFNNCTTPTEFLFVGGNYSGDLDFYDHKKNQSK